MAVDLSRQKELHVDLKAIQQIDFVRQLKNDDGVMQMVINPCLF